MGVKGFKLQKKGNFQGWFEKCVENMLSGVVYIYTNQVVQQILVSKKLNHCEKGKK